MSKHTPGPWTFDGPADNVIVWSAPNHRICFMTSNGNAKANARLIAAAPQLLEVVQIMQGANWQLGDDVGMEIRRRALAAVQKALDPVARDPSPEIHPTGWQDISSAARDGSEVLVWNGRRRHVAHFDKIEGEWVSSFKTTTKRLVVAPPPTHWSPLPNEPATTEGQDNG